MRLDRSGFYRLLVLAETAWLMLFGFVIFAYVRSNQLKLLLAPWWAWIEVTGGALAVLTGTAVLLLGRKQEEAYIRDCLKVRSRMHPVYRAVGLVLLAAVLAIGLLIPGRTLTAGLTGTTDVRNNPLVKVGGEALKEARKKRPGQRNNKDWLVIFSQDPYPERYKGEMVSLAGRVWDKPGLKKGDFCLVRYLFTHCVSCAQPMMVYCRMVAGGEVPEVNEWVKVEGRVALDRFDGEMEPYVEVIRYDVIATPEDPYIYP